MRKKTILHEKAPLMDQNISDYVALFASRLVVTPVKDNGWLQSKSSNESTQGNESIVIEVCIKKLIGYL